eukprot:4354153-Alexandrium_andersonii.AAC.1
MAAVPAPVAVQPGHAEWRLARQGNRARGYGGGNRMLVVARAAPCQSAIARQMPVFNVTGAEAGHLA